MGIWIGPTESICPSLDTLAFIPTLVLVPRPILQIPFLNKQLSTTVKPTQPSIITSTITMPPLSAQVDA